jgi:hypothetical protein
VVTKASTQDRIGVKLPDGISLAVKIENLEKSPSIYVIRWIRSTDVRDWDMEVVYAIETISNDPREAMGYVTGESYERQVDNPVKRSGCTPLHTVHFLLQRRDRRNASRLWWR